MVSRTTKFSRWWLRAGLGSRVFLFFIGCAVLSFLVYGQWPSDSSEHQSGNFTFFALVNLNIAILCVFIFLVGRNVAKLVFDRRRRILGSKLRLRLVFALVSVALVPTIVLFLIATGLLNKAVDGWFSGQVELSHRAALELAQQYYSQAEEEKLRLSQSLQLELQEEQLNLEDKSQLDNWLERSRKENGLYSITVLSAEGKVLADSLHAAATLEDFSEPSLSEEAIGRLQKGETSSYFEEQGANRFLRVYSPLSLFGGNSGLVITHRFSSELSAALLAVNDAYEEYEQLKLFKNPIRSSYSLTLAMITGLILFAAIWFGFYLARELTEPVQRLAEGTREVARGNYDFQLRATGDDEIAVLIRSFNTMTQDLKSSRTESENRRLFIETILSNLALAVIALDRKDRVTLMNVAALKLFAHERVDEVRLKSLAEVLPESLAAPIEEMIREGREDRDGSAHRSERELFYESDDRGERRLVCTAGALNDVNEKWLGTVLLFDDITDLAHAQRLAAWREVARRIAHEIKNPLTPILLSAQRLLRLGKQEKGNEEAISAAETIVQNVDSIKRLANEFSRFAMAPQAEFSKTDLNALIAETLDPYAEQYANITLQFIPEAELPVIELDREQIRRLIMNLVTNACDAINRVSEGAEAGVIEHGKVLVRTRSLRTDSIQVEIADNGPGIDEQDKGKVFQPYFTTKETGTGLGLAIVNTIVNDHGGNIRLEARESGGSKFIIQLPLKPPVHTQRKFAPPEERKESERI